MVSIPGSRAVVSTFVDTVEDAAIAVADGASDLLLRDWDTERIGELRDALEQGQLVERTVFPLGVEYDDAAEELESGAFAAYLNQIDGSTRARPRTDWAPGRDVVTPEPISRLSAAWPDQAWRDAVSDPTSVATPEIERILAAALAGTAPTRDEIEVLFRAHGADVEAIAEVADTLRRKIVGDDVTFIVNRNINYTNQCYFKCGFCAFSKGPRSLDLRGEPYLMSIDEIVDRSAEGVGQGCHGGVFAGRHPS